MKPRRITRLVISVLELLLALAFLWGSSVFSQPPLPREVAQTQSTAEQAPAANRNSRGLPIPTPSSQQPSGNPPMPVPEKSGSGPAPFPVNPPSNQNVTVTGQPTSSTPFSRTTPPSTPAPAQQPGGEVPSIKPSGNEKPVSLNQQKPSPKRGEVSFNFDDADVYSVIQTIFGGVLKFNYIIDPKVKGRVNFRSVSPVAKEDVLPLMEVILRLNGIGVVEEGGLYRIIPIGDMPREPATVKIGRQPEKVNLTGLGLLQVIPIRYFTSTEMVRVLTPFLSANAVIVDVPKINYLIVVDTDANVKRLLQLVEIFDSEQLKQIKPQVFVYPVQYGKAEDLSALLQQIYLGTKPSSKTATTTTTTTTTSANPANPPLTPIPLRAQVPTTPTTPASITVGPTTSAGEALVSEITRIYPDKVTNSLIILATPEDYALILETLKKIDTVPRQVMIEVLIAEITLTDEFKFGLEWSLRSMGAGGFTNITGSFTSTTQTSSTSTTGTTVVPPGGFTFLGIDKTGLIRGVLNTLANQGKTNILASPHILAADNREAKIQIGSQVPIVTDVTSTTVTTQTVQYKDTGVILKIKPTINDSGLVSLEMSQEVSSYVFQQIGTNTFPVFTKREASTYMVAQDGQTIVVGGLIQDQKGKTRTGLPFLSKIPILGYLFGYTDDTFSRSEIVLLLTPHVVRNQKEAENLTDFYIHRLDKSVKKQVIKENLIPQKEKQDTK